MDGNTALHHSILPDKIHKSSVTFSSKTTLLLLERKDIDIDVRNKKGKTPLQLCRMQQQNSCFIEIQNRIMATKYTFQ
jgi:ankyrin repeat protein